MATRVRKTILQNPLDEIPARDKLAPKVATPIKKSSGAKKTMRASKASQTDVTPEASATAVKRKKNKASEGSSTQVKLESPSTKTSRAKPSSSRTVAKEPTRHEVNDGATTNTQTAEKLMAAELVRPSVTISRREEDVIAQWCAPVKVLDQPGVAGASAGVGPIAAEFLTAEDIFQNELIRARVSVKAEATKTSLSAHKIVSRWSRWSLAASVVPLPLMDMAAISGVQVKMIYELCKTYEVDFEHKAAVAIASGVAGGAAAQTLAGVIAKQMLRFAPGVGQVFMFAVEPLISYVTTQAIGLAFISHFEADGRMHDFNPEKIKQFMAAQIEKRKQMFKSKISPQQA